MSELTGGLIQMTAHMVRRPGDYGMIVVGIVIASVCLLLALCAGLSRQGRHKRRYVLGFVAFAAIGAAIAITGASQPRVQELKCCASGPISLEDVAAVYDIRDVDGKLITLWKR